LLGDLELHRPLGLLLHHDCPGRDPRALDNVMYAEPNQITPAQLAVDGKVEQCKFPRSMIQLQPIPYRADLLQLQRGLLGRAPCPYSTALHAFGLGGG
jgi:hypothetical protein